jgi:hypothetical protein
MKEKKPPENSPDFRARKLRLTQLKVTQMADENLFRRLEQAEVDSRETVAVRIDSWDLQRLKKLAKPTIEKYLLELADLEISIESDVDETITGVETVESVFGSEEWDPSELPEDGDESYH